MLNITYQSIGRDTLDVDLSGKMYAEQAAELRLGILNEIERGRHHLRFHMSRLSYIDSAGLGVLVSIYKRVMKNGGTMRLQGLKGEVKEIFELTRLDTIFDIHA